MPITLTINGETAEQILAELRALAGGLKHEWKAGENVRMAAEPVVHYGQPVPPASDFGFTLAPDTSNTFYPEDVASQPPAEDKPKRKRRTKEEMEAERAAGLPPQEGAPELWEERLVMAGNTGRKVEGQPEPDPYAVETILVPKVVDDILDDDTSSAPAAATRDDVKTYMSKIIQQRLLTPAEIKAIFIERAGGATNAAAMDEKFAADVLTGLTEAAEKKSA